jgi:hypothetical protein
MTLRPSLSPGRRISCRVYGFRFSGTVRSAESAFYACTVVPDPGSDVPRDWLRTGLLLRADEIVGWCHA